MSDLPAPVEKWRAQGRLVEVDGRSVFVVEMGSGEPAVLILHGFPASSFDWRIVMPELARHRRVVAFDFLGHGLTDKPTGRYSLFEQADIAERVAALTGIERCVMVSHDMGDTVAAELMKRQSEGGLGFGIDRAVLTNGSIFIDLVQLSPGQQALLALPDEALTDSLPLEAFAPGIAVLFAAEHQPSSEELECMLALVRHNDGDRVLPRVIRYIEERRKHQDRWTAGLVGFAGPMTAFWGEQDPIAVVPMAHRLGEIRPGTEIVTWPDVGHWPSLEVPERLAGEILARL